MTPTTQSLCYTTISMSLYLYKNNPCTCLGSNEASHLLFWLGAPEILSILAFIYTAAFVQCRILLFTQILEEAIRRLWE